MAMIALSKRSNQAVAVEILNDEGEALAQFTINRFKPREILKLAGVWKRAQPEVLRAVNAVCEQPDDTTFTDELEIDAALIESIQRGDMTAAGVVDPTDRTAASGQSSTAQAPTNHALTLYVRGLTQLKANGLRFVGDDAADVLRRAFVEPLGDSTIREPLIEWSDTERLCCLDVDYHALDVDARPTASELRAVFDRIKPQPLLYHLSHGNGAKLYYLSSPGYTARELAAVAGVSWVTADPRATFDLTHTSRHPCYARTRDARPAPVASVEELSWVYGQSDVSTLRKLLAGELDYEDVRDYLSSRGWEFGAVRPHSECPISPTNDFKENVFVGERGIMCHRCQARGFGAPGSPGFVPYSQLVGTSDNRLASMVRNFCHLEHASIVLANVWPNVPARTLADVYRVMLKVIHQPDDPRIELAMRAGKGFVRTRGMWVTSDGREVLDEGKLQFVNTLPATKFVSRAEDSLGKLLPDVARVVAFLNKGELDEYGYPDVSFIRGARIYGVHLPYKDCENIKIITRPEFRDCAPTYVPLTKRMPIEEAWNFLENEFAGINRNYVKLLIASKGASEGRLAQCPYLLVSGVSGAGKSTTVQIVAGLCGDRAEEPIYTPNVERFRAALMDAARNSGFVCVNEIFKMSHNARLTPTQALDPLLSLTEESRSHVLYIGSVPFGRLPVFVLTDIDFPPEVERDIQLARRFTFFQLPTANNWQDNLVAKNFRPHELRRLSYEHNAAADAIVSDVIDEFFTTPTPLYKIAESLDCGSLAQASGEMDRVNITLREFYALAINGPRATGPAANRYPAADGWRLIDRAHQTPLVEAWEELCDGREPDVWVRSRIATSTDWARVLRLPKEVGPVTCDLKAARNNAGVYVRFRSAGAGKRISWVNGETRT